MIDRRSLITGLVSFVAAPAIVRVESLMKLPPKRLMIPEEIINNIVYHMPNRYLHVMMDELIKYGNTYGKFGNGLDYSTYQPILIQDILIDHS